MIGNYKSHQVFEHTMSTVLKIKVQTLADPGFPVGGQRHPSIDKDFTEPSPRLSSDLWN